MAPTFHQALAASGALLLALPGSSAYTVPPGTPPPRARRSDLPAVTRANELLEMATAELFIFEHTRAFKYEHFGWAESNYWDDPRIHNFGNTGWRGYLHAMVVPFATHMIDTHAYSGIDARKRIHETFIPRGAEVADLCSGVGFSPTPHARVTCVDTSDAMLAMAKLRKPKDADFTYEVGNAEEWGEDRCVDISTVMYGMHEMPQDGRRRVLRNAMRIARDSLVVADIWPGFEPTPMMLSGEPYVLDYLKHIEEDIDHVASVAPDGGAEWRVTRVDVVDEHVRVWKLDRVK